MTDRKSLLMQLPKAELHLHIEGSLEPELMFRLAERNGIPLPYPSVDALRAAYDFGDLQSFLNLYYQGMAVLKSEEDFRDLALDYLRRAAADGVVHVDMHFDPQAHLSRGVPFDAVMSGLLEARRQALAEYDVSSSLILAILRDQPVDSAMATLDEAESWVDDLVAIGLDSAERGNPPGRFREVFDRAAGLGLARVAHAGEEGPPGYIREALDQLQVCRIDHGVRCLEDPELVSRLRDSQTVLTVCPLSNVRLKVVPDLHSHPLPTLLEAGLNVTINSDDPAYFGGGLLTNFDACSEAFNWSDDTLFQLADNALKAAFMPEGRRAGLRQRLGDLQTHS